MASMTGSRVFFGLVLLAGVALSGCGRKAPLDTPYEAAVQAREDAAEAGQPVPPEPEQPRADRPFILDRSILSGTWVCVNEGGEWKLDRLEDENTTPA